MGVITNIEIVVAIFSVF